MVDFQAGFRRRHYLLFAGVALGVLAAGPAAQAQEAPPSQSEGTQDDSEQEEIVVSGIRQSVQASIDVKRKSAAVMDAITAEDIGKLPDQNIIETLQRVPGVQINRGTAGQASPIGEGQGFIIRGIGQNRVEFNGTNVVGANGGGDVSLSDFNPEILAGLTVTKSPSARDIEGALGGVVNLQSRKPLSLDPMFVSGRVEGIYYDQSKDIGYRASGVVSTKFANDTIGVLVGVNRYDYRRLTNEVDNGGYTLRNNIDVTGDNVADPGIIVPNRYVANYLPAHIRRTGVDGSIQWRPTPSFELNFDMAMSWSTLDQDATRYQVLLTTSVTNAMADSNGTLVSGTYNNVTPRVAIYDEYQTAKQHVFALYGKWETGRLTVEGRAARSGGDSRSVQFVPLYVPKAGLTSSIFIDYQAAGDLPTGVLTTNFNTLDPSRYRLDTTVDSVDFTDNSGDDLKLDLSYDVGGGFLQELNVGARYEKLSFSTDRLASNIAVASVLAANPGFDRNGDGQIGYDEFSGGLELSAINDYFSGTSGNIPRSFLVGSVDRDTFLDAIGFTSPQDPNNVRMIDQDTKAAYAQVDFGGALGAIDIFGNFGVRYVNTDRTAAGLLVSGSSILPVSYKATFEDWLPSFNLRAGLTRDLIFRLAAGKVLARPGLGSVAPGTRLNLVAMTASRGNPYLNPFKATQYDATVEWYFAPASILAISGFYKDVDSFTVQTTTTEYIDAGPLSGNYQVSQPSNGQNGTIKGFEVNYQQVFRGLPAFIDGLGVGASYTYVDSKTPLIDSITGENSPLTGLSRNSFNGSIFLEQAWGNVRFTYSWRQGYLELIGTANQGGNRYLDDRGQLDFSGQINVTDKVKLLISAVNLTKAPERWYHYDETRLRGYRVNDRRFYFGVSAAF